MDFFDFSSNETVEDINAVPSEFQGYYTQDKANNKYTLKADVKGLAEAYSGVGKRLKEATTRRGDDNAKDAARRQALKAISDGLTEAGVQVEDDITKLPDIVKGHLASLNDKVKTNKQQQIDLEGIKTGFQKQIADIKTEADGKVTAMSKSLEKFMISGEASRVLAEAKVVDKGIELLMPHVVSSTRMVQNAAGEFEVQVVDANGQPRFNAKAEAMGIKDLVGDLKKSFPAAFASDTKGGTGARQGNTPVKVAGQVTPKQVADTGEKTTQQKINDGLAARRAG